MMHAMKYLTLLLFLFTLLPANAQPTTDEQLAAHYYQSGEYDKAAIYYEKLYAQKPSDFYYNYFLKCLIQLGDYDRAEKLARRQSKRFSSMGKYLVDLGNIYAKKGEPNKARQQYEKAIRQLQPNQNAITGLSKAFLSIGAYEFALASLQKGQKLMRGYYPFNFEMAEVYGAMGKYKEMIDAYLDLLNINEHYLQSVQNALNRYFPLDQASEQNALLKKELLRRVQRNPGQTVFNEMLTWIYIQQKDFGQAYVMTRALDRKLKAQGERMYALAQICTRNQAYDIAVKCYRYIIENEADGYYYTGSKMGLLQVLNQKILSGDYTRAELLSLERQYYAAIEEFGYSSAGIEITKDLARLQALYLHKTDTARALLESAVNAPGINRQLQAKCKIELADVLLMQNEIWDASLLLSQVEKAFKYDPIGDEAKFRNAKIAFYTGDFKWAKSKLDILKGSTSKLIANDAMYLSLLISDNTGIDTTLRPLMMFARGEYLSYQNKDKQALLTLDSIHALYPGHALDDDILMLRSKIAMKSRSYEQAADFLRQITVEYGDDLLGDDATFKLAELYDKRLNDKEKAMHYYHEVLTNYPGSLYVVEARKRFRTLRGDNPESLKKDYRGLTTPSDP